jgi:TPR repeat protein
MRPVVALFLAVLLLPALARADFEAGTRAYEAGDFAAAMQEWRPLAEDGDVAAMRNLGQMYRLGQGVERDPAEAARWYRRAADIGFDRAQANLAALYLSGEGVDRDPARAAYWFEMAARQGHVISMYNLGLMYETGMGLPHDLPRALGWLNLAARAGHPQAIEKLSELVLEAPPPRQVAAVAEAEASARQEAPAAPPPPAEAAPSAAVVPDPVPAAPSAPAGAAPSAAPPATAKAAPAPPPEKPARAPRSFRSEQTDPNLKGVPHYNLFGMIASLFEDEENEAPKPAPAAPDVPAATEPPAATAPPALLVPEPRPGAAAALSGTLAQRRRDEIIAAGLREHAAGNFQRAQDRWQPLADAGDAEAQMLVGALYAGGEGRERDRVRAFMWWILAAQGGNEAAQERADILGRELTDQERADGFTLARNFRPAR